MKLQKLGGTCAIVYVCVTVILIAIALPLASRYGLMESGAGIDPAKQMAAYTGLSTLYRALQPVDILTGILLLLVALALQERMQANAPNLMRLLIIAASVSCALRLTGMMNGVRGLASMTGASDISIYRPFLVMQNGFDMAASHAWGWALLLIGWAAISTRALPRLLSYILLVCGIVEVISFALPNIPREGGIVILIVFLFLNLIGAIWLGVVLLRKQEPAAG